MKRRNYRYRRREIDGAQLLPRRYDDLPLFQTHELQDLADHLRELHELTPEEIIDGALEDGEG